MHRTRTLEDFAARIRAAGRILYADVRRLVRDVLPHGIVERRHAEILMDLDREIERADSTFHTYLVDEVARYAVWDDRPTGRLDVDKTAWLCGVLCRERITPTGAAIAVAAIEESEIEIPELLAIARRRKPCFAAWEAAIAEDAQHAEHAHVDHGDYPEIQCDCSTLLVQPSSVHADMQPSP